jgi:uncharacterized alkaline shock family protein YloU
MPTSELVIARAVRSTVCAVTGVADVSPGLFAETGTYGPGETVRGVAVSRVAGGLDLEVHVIGVYADSVVLRELADRVRTAVRQSVEALGAEAVRRIDVVIDDLYIDEDRA